MRKVLAVFFLMFTMVLAACQPVTIEEATANYCESLQAFNTARLAVKGLDADSTVDETQAAFTSLRVAYHDLRQASSSLTESELEALDQAYQDLENVAREIEGSMTLGEAQATVQDAQAAVDTAWEQLYADADCANVLVTQQE